jgi:uncharacterized protein Usg
MAEFIVRGRLIFPFEAEVSADQVDASFDLAAHFGVPENMVGYWALEEDGPLSSSDQMVTVSDTQSSYVIDDVERVVGTD